MGKHRFGITIFGDSIAAGLGTVGGGYGNVLSSMLEEAGAGRVDFQDLSGSAKTIPESRSNLEECSQFSPDIVLLAHGVTESIIRPHERYLKYLPRRWRKPGWLDPRPYFSSRLIRHISQKLESELRWRFKVALIKHLGGCEWIPVDRFETEMKKFVDALLKRTNCHVLIIPPFAIDEKYFPRTPDNFRVYRKSLSGLADDEGERVYYCDIQDVCEVWGDFFADHFHPNDSGNSRIAEALYSRILDAGLLDKKRK